MKYNFGVHGKLNQTVAYLKAFHHHEILKYKYLYLLEPSQLRVKTLICFPCVQKHCEQLEHHIYFINLGNFLKSLFENNH